MVNYADIELFSEDSLPKNLIITYDNVTLTNSDIVSESFELTEILCPDENITLGSCNASQVKFRIGYIAQSLIGKTITVSIQPQGGAVLQIGVYKIDSDKRTADRRYKDIVAYDVMKDILEKDVADWYKGLFTTPTATYTLKQFRDSFFTYVGVTQETTTLINDSLTVSYTIDPEKLSGKDVIEKICEINGCFGHIGRDGKFHYIYLSNLIPALYPSEDLYPAEDLYPSDGANVTNIDSGAGYISSDYEDYETAPITKLQIRQSEDDIGAVIGSGTNTYVIEDNFLVYGLNATQLNNVGTPILTKLGNIRYIPMTVELRGNPCYEVGDGIEFCTRYAVIYSYIFKRTLKGIQALFDTFESTGTETLGTNINSVNSQISQLKGRTNKLTRTVDETISELSAYETTTNGTLEQHRTAIAQNADQISIEATRAKGVEVDLSAAITVQAGQISQKVSKGTVSSEITQEAGQITIQSNRLVVDSTYFKLYADGTGKLGGLTFDSIGFYSVYQSSKVFQVHPDPSDGYAVTVGTNTFRRYRDDQFQNNQYRCQISHDGDLEVTVLNVKDEYDGFTIQRSGKIHADSMIDCWGNVIAGAHSNHISHPGGSLYAYHTEGTTGGQSGSVFADNEIVAGGWHDGLGNVKANNNVQAGNDVIYGNACYQGSDERIKKDIKPLEDSEELIYNLKPVSYRYKRNDKQEHSGLIAQDVQKLVPEESAIIHTDDEGIMSIGYIELIAHLINTVQSQNKRISDLEERLAKSEGQLNG